MLNSISPCTSASTLPSPWAGEKKKSMEKQEKAMKPKTDGEGEKKSDSEGEK